MDLVNDLLVNKFGLRTFRLGQKAIIESILAGRDVLAVMPTGGGKSLCYQLPAMAKPGICIVVSPLIALMNDQVRALRQNGIPAGCIHSGLSMAERKAIFSGMATSERFILYLSPERVQKPGFAVWLKAQKMSLFAVDEAHCISKWGHDFRPEYGQLSRLREIRPEVPLIALTATATPQVKADIVAQLKLQSPEHHVYGFYRPNLFYQVESCDDEQDKIALVQQAIRQTPTGRILLYCGTRKKAEAWAEMLKEENESVAFYHAGMSAQERVTIEEGFQSQHLRILTATNAFGMGIDIPDIRLVIHTQMPGNIESYYQEIGRAGRDGEPSACLMLYSRRDKGLHSFFITESQASASVISHRWQALDAMVQYCEGAECRHGDILTYFKDRQRIKHCGHCDTCAPQSALLVHRPTYSTESALPKQKGKKAKKAKALVAEIPPDQQWRVEVLREWRKNFAREHDMPAFMVFSDRTLRDLVLRAPSTTEDLYEVYGLGEKKISVLGEIILRQLNGEVPC